MDLKKLLFFLFIAIQLFGYTVNDYHPRIWLTPSSTAIVRARCATGGNLNSVFKRITNWCDSHINDGLSSGTDFDENLNKFATAHILTPEDTQYGDRIVTILDYLADNAQDWGNYWDEDTDRSGIDNQAWWEVPSALAIAYDWCFDRIDGHANESAIESYIQRILEVDCGAGSWSGATCSAYDADPGTWHKTEENWGYIILALAIAGEQGSTENSRVATVLSRAEDFLISSSNEWSGSYVKANNYVATNGYFLYTDGYENDITNSFTYVAAWHTATTDNLTAYPWWCNRARAALAVLPPDGQYPKIGEVQPYGTSSKIQNSDRGGGTVWYLAGAYYNSASSDYFGALAALNAARGTGDWEEMALCLWTDGTEDYSTLDRVYHFDRHGGFAFRSGWDFTNSTDIVGEIRGFKPFPNDHWVAHSGHLDLRRGGDYLLVSGGAYTGSYWNHPSSDDYNQDSDGQNTIHIDNREHRSRSDGLADAGTSMADDEYGETKRLQYVDGDYVYGLYDMTNAFETADVNHTTGKVYRSLAFLDDQFIFVHDYISKVTAADNVRTLWHLDSEPADDGSGWTDSGQSASTTGTTSTDATEFHWTEGSSKCWVRVVEPTSGVTFRKRGGSWGTAFVDIDGTNHSVSSYTYYHYGLWTVETEIVNPASTTLDFLYVIQAKSSGESETTVERLTGAGYIGACVRATTRCAALFSDNGGDKTGVTFSVTDNSGMLKAVVANLAPETYGINGTGSYSVDSDGLLYFTADLSITNHFIITQGGIPPVNNAPVFTTTNLGYAIVNSSYAFQLSALDPDNDPLSYSKLIGPNWLNVSNAGLISGIPALADTGTTGVSVRVTDGELSDTLETTITVQSSPPSNRPPEFTTTSLDTAYSNIAYSFQLLATDEDDDDLTFTKLIGPGWMTVSSSGMISGTPGNSDVGISDVQIQVDDGELSDFLSTQIIVEQISSPEVEISAYPIPYKPGEGGNNTISFINLPVEGKLIIFDMLGNPLIKIDVPASTYAWDVKNQSGKDISSGVYLYIVNDSQGKKKHSGKLIVVR